MSKKRREDAWDSNGLQDWGSYMAAKKSKLEDQFGQLAQAEFQNATNLFKGIAIFVNGYTNPCADVLKRLMMEHGGVYHTYQRSNSTTHLIASNLPYSKIIQYRKSKNPLPLCKPEWITDSIKLNKLLDWRPYLLYNNTSVTQPQLKLTNEANVTEDTSKIQENSSFLTKPQDPAIKSSEPSNVKNLQDKPSKDDENHFNSRGTALCSRDEEFLSEFYNNSRLHHIATMGATFKEYVNELRAKNDGSLPGLARLKALTSRNSTKIPKLSIQDKDSDSDEDFFGQEHPKCQRGKEPVIMHIDMDCFFVSVGLRNKPELRGHPVAVTHAKGSKPSSKGHNEKEEFGSMSEIASCSYEARKLGLKNGMFLGQALKLCPNLKTIKYDFEGYKEISIILYDTVASYTLDIEAVSCDEMYADVSKILDELNLTPDKFASIIRAEIKEKTGCPVSTGFGSNKLQARLATKKAKPDGQFYLKRNNVEAFIGELEIGEIPGVGWSTTHQLHEMNVKSCQDLQKITLGVLQEKFGKKSGEMLFNTCRGIDHSKLHTEHVRKSVSAEINYGIRFQTDNDAREFLIKLAKEVCSRLLKINAKGRCVTLKLMVRAKNAPVEPPKFMGHGLCDNFTKTKNFISPIDNVDIIIKDVLLLWEQMQQPAHEIRGIGIQISRLENSKRKTAHNSLMKFIETGKLKNNEKTQDQVKNVVNSERNPTYEAKKNVQIKKNQDLKVFFSSKRLLNDDPKEKFNAVVQKSNIDESVLTELPEDIRLDILKMHNHDVNMKNLSISDDRNTQKLSAQVGANENLSNGKFTSQLERLDEDVLIELPEDIRNEVLASNRKVKKSQSNGITNYFKHKKHDTSFKAKMPTMQELDMQVLTELPVDIRNEILNEYKNDFSADAKNTLQKLPLQEADLNVSQTEYNQQPCENLNFSQIDPEFLAALDNESRNDVEQYCLAKKNEKESKLKNMMMEKTQSVADTNKKKRSRKSKALILTAIRTTNPKAPLFVKKPSSERYNDQLDIRKKSPSFLEHQMSILEDEPLDNNRGGESIRFYPYNSYNEGKTEQQQMLNTLVNYLFSLPLQQVKGQIHTWIKNSDYVNEIDSLSIITYLSMLPKKKRIEDLHVLMKTMHRCMTETGSCVWHGTYRKTVEYVQQCMQIEYNSNLMLPAIRCNLRECKSDRV
ncbi:DNA repair protein REV1 isoform X2 [Diachasmimorpha longicaudata]